MARGPHLSVSGYDDPLGVQVKNLFGMLAARFPKDVEEYPDWRTLTVTCTVRGFIRPKMQPTFEGRFEESLDWLTLDEGCVVALGGRAWDYIRRCNPGAVEEVDSTAATDKWCDIVVECSVE